MHSRDYAQEIEQALRMIPQSYPNARQYRIRFTDGTQVTVGSLTHARCCAVLSCYSVTSIYVATSSDFLAPFMPAYAR